MFSVLPTVNFFLSRIKFKKENWAWAQLKLPMEQSWDSNLGSSGARAPTPPLHHCTSPSNKYGKLEEENIFRTSHVKLNTVRYSIGNWLKKTMAAFTRKVLFYIYEKSPIIFWRLFSLHSYGGYILKDFPHFQSRE